MPSAGQRDEHVAAFMDQQLAVDAPVALPREAPYPFTALAAVRPLVGGRQAEATVRGRGPQGPRSPPTLPPAAEAAVGQPLCSA